MIKKTISIVLLLAVAHYLDAQTVGIGTTAPSSSAMLEIKSSDKGLLIPRTSTTTRNTIPGVKGLLVYDTTTSSFWFHTGSAWTESASGNNVWGVNGNGGTNPSANYIGTSDNVNVVFKRANTRAGLLATGNTSFGVSALNELGTGNNNTATGYRSLFSNTTGDRNSAYGQFSLYYNTTGDFNVAIGSYALDSNSTGYNNTAVGTSAMLANTTGYQNTAVGSDALRYNTSGVAIPQQVFVLCFTTPPAV